jgi:hypothetical protein
LDRANEVLIGGKGGIPRDNGVGYSKKLFASRVGFAYQVTNSTVIRSGYGITYHSHPWGAQALRGWYPLTLVAVFSGVNGYQPVTTDRAYVAANIPNQPLGSNVGIPSICCPAFLDINASQIPGSGDEGRPLFAKFGRTTPTREWDGRTHSVYHALQTTLNRRFSRGLLIKSAYTWSKGNRRGHLQRLDRVPVERRE